MNLDNKHIALICPKFYGYENYIANELRNRGATVYLIYENIEWVRILYRIIYVYLPQYKERLLRSYYKKELTDILNRLNYFVVIRGSSLRPDIMKWVKGNTPSDCKFIMYQWDGIKNNQTALEIVSYFDRVSTFDQEDAERYGWVYRPLFYLPEYVDQNVEKDIDILFICALHSNRARVLNQLKLIAADKEYKLRTVVYLNKVLYYKYKYINKKAEVVEADNRDLTFKPLSIKESYSLYSRSKVVVDYTNINQTGFTMRTIESLGNHCKIITNNARIKEADFYNEKNVHIYDEDNLTIPEGLVAAHYDIIDEKIYEKYSLKSWVNELIGITQ